MKKLTFEDFIIKCKIVHGELYDYSKTIYNGVHNKVIILCEIHGEFLQTPSSHIYSKQGCRKCYESTISARCNKGLDKFLEQSKVIHNNFYDYSKFNYISAHVKSEIICPLHGSFQQSSNSHLKGHRCNKCAMEKSDKWGWSKDGWISRCKGKQAKLYVVKLYNDKEIFIKVGITSKDKISYRLNQIPYKYEVLKTIEDTPENVWNLENRIKRDFRKKYKYIPEIIFKGMYECYDLLILNEII